jgi:ATP phosphoribosyltransferase
VNVPVKIALPKGRLLRKTAAMLHKAGWDLDEYTSNMGFYRPVSRRFPELRIRVCHEKDIPIQIATGNYDLGICGLDWIEELLAKYPGSAIVKVMDLGYGRGTLYMAASGGAGLQSNGTVRIASEYPNLAGAYALKQRLSRFSVFPVWGAAEAYPPENADLALVSAKDRAEMAGCGMSPVGRVLDHSAFLIASRAAWECRDLDEIVASICGALSEPEKPPLDDEGPEISPKSYHRREASGAVRLALPDGHQQQQTCELLGRAGIRLDDYPSATGNRRPGIDIEGTAVKVIRPQDMPLQVANGNFDLAITGRDWLTDHLDQFPSSPVRQILDLGLRRVRLVAVVSQDLAADDAAGLRELMGGRDEPLRVASEYVNIADRYARENHLGYYRVIPTWGATEAFLPEDADLLIENTETGRTIARHNLKIIDTLFESTACLIGNAASLADSARQGRIEEITNRLRKAIA